MRCIFAREAWARLLAEAAAASDGTETGGALVGDIAGDLFTVYAVTGPGPGAVRRYAWFERKEEAIAPEMERLRAVGLEDIGGWHTHFQPEPIPSVWDDNTGREQAQWRGSFWDPVNLEVILGVNRAGHLLAIRAWCYDPEGGRVEVPVSVAASEGR